MSNEPCPINIRQLKQFLIDKEKLWNQTDKDVLGEFDDQQIYIDLAKGGVDIAIEVYYTHEFGLTFKQAER